METIEQKPKSNIIFYIIIIILIAAILMVYFVFFASEKITKKQNTVTTVNVATQETGALTSQKSTFNIKTGTSTTDVTGGLSNLKLVPEDILNNPIFQSLHSYAEPVELPTLGRPNPFIPY